MMIKNLFSIFSIAALATAQATSSTSKRSTANSLVTRAAYGTNQFSVDCPKFNNVLTSADAYFSHFLPQYVSNDFVSIPCSNKYFYMTFGVNAGTLEKFTILVSGNERPQGAASALLEFPLKSSQTAAISIMAPSGNTNYGQATAPSSYGVAKTFFLAYDSTGISIGADGVVLSTAKTDDSVKSLLSAGNLYIRSGSDDSVMSINNISFKCLSGSSCNVAQLPNTLKPGSESNKNKNLICDNAVDTVTSSKKVDDIKFSNQYTGKIDQIMKFNNAIPIPSNTGVFNVTFGASQFCTIDAMISNSKDYLGSTFEVLKYGLDDGKWSIGNSYDLVEADGGKPDSYGLNMFFSLDPSGFSIGYNNKKIVSLGYDKFDMDDLLSKGTVYFIPAPKASGTTINNIVVNVMSRSCTSPATTSTITATSTVTQTSTTQTTSTKTVSSSSVATSTLTSTNTSTTTITRNGRNRTVRTTTTVSNPVTVQNTQTITTTVSSTSVVTIPGSTTTRTRTVSQSDATVTATTTSRTTVLSTRTRTVGSTLTVPVTTIATVTSTTTTANCPTCQTRVVVPAMTLSVTKNKDYSQSTPITMPCANYDWTFTGSITAASDFYFALTTSDDVASSSGYVEIRLGMQSGTSSISSIIRNPLLAKRADSYVAPTTTTNGYVAPTTTTNSYQQPSYNSNKTSTFKLSYIGGVLRAYLDGKLIKAIKRPNFEVKKFFPIPFSGSATLNNGLLILTPRSGYSY